MALKMGGFKLGRFKFENLYNTYLGMNSREQTVALVVAGAVLILLVVLPVLVAHNRISSLEENVDEGRKQLKDVMAALESYGKKKIELSQVEQTLAGGYDESITSTLEAIAEKVGIKDRIDALKEKATAPSDIFDETSVDVRLKKVRLPQLVDFLYAIEHEPGKVLKLNKLSIKSRFDNKSELDVSFSVSTYRLQERLGEEEGEEKAQGATEEEGEVL